MSADIIFFQQYAVPYFGVLSLAAYLKNRGIKADVLIESLEEDFISSLRKLNPKLIGLSVLSPEHKWLIDKSSFIRKAFPEVPIIVGGTHAMFYPEEILSETSVDLVCHSEGEDVLFNVIRELERSNPDWSSMEGLAYKDAGGTVHINERARLVPLNDEIIEDRAIYFERYPQLAYDTVHRFFSSRGCPYKCAFCYNAKIHDIFRGKGNYIRQKTVNNFMEEIVSQCARYPITSIFFYDDLFTFNKKWLKEFLQRYKEKVGIPFMCTTRANLLNEETVNMLANAGCRTASYGIETGDYKIRKDILKKNVTDEEIVRCGQLLKKYGIKSQTTNMFCLPEETLEAAYKTIELNIRACTDYAFSALFLPFPKTEIAEYCIQRGFVKHDYSLKDIPYSFLTASVLKIPDKDGIRNIHRLAYFSIKWPWFYRLTKKLVRLHYLDFFFHLIFVVSNLFRHKEERGISLWHAIRYAWRLRSSL